MFFLMAGVAISRSLAYLTLALIDAQSPCFATGPTWPSLLSLLQNCVCSSCSVFNDLALRIDGGVSNPTIYTHRNMKKSSFSDTLVLLDCTEGGR